MNSNGSRQAKPNKWGGIRKKQYICPNCNKTQVTNLEKFIKRFSNYTRPICEKALEYESISYLPYQKKSELIELENGIKLNRQTVYYHESTYSDSFITQKEENLQKILKEMKIEPSGTYHYDEVRQDRAFSPIKSVKYPNFGNFNPCCLGFPPSKFLIW